MKKLRVTAGFILITSSILFAQTEADIELSKGTDSNEALIFTFGGSSGNSQLIEINQVGSSNFAYATGSSFSVNVDQQGVNHSVEVKGFGTFVNASIEQINEGGEFSVGNNASLSFQGSNREGGFLRIIQNEDNSLDNTLGVTSTESNKIFYKSGALSNDVEILQRGKGNNIVLNVGIQDVSRVEIEQIGVSNTIEVNKVGLFSGSGDPVLITQEGAENNINVLQTSPTEFVKSENIQTGFMNSINVVQSNGNTLKSQIEQSGFSNVAAVDQMGVSNTSLILQEGDALNAIVLQTGENNSAVISQKDRLAFSGDEASISQEGSYNEAEILQRGQGFGTLDGSITQIGGVNEGESNYANLEQEAGSTQSAIITQEYVKF